MEFFCPKCQKKHSVTAITADLLSICKEGIQTGLNDMVKSGKLEAKAVIQLNNLSKVISGITDRTFLAYKREDLRAMLNDVVPEANGFSGEFILTIGNLRQRLEERMSNAARPIAWEDLDDFMNVAAVRKEMTFQYAMNNEGEYVFTSCQENGDYFPDGPQGKMLLGYRRICSECGAVLHQCTGLAPELVVVLAGSPRAGKTSCITAVVNSLYESNFINGLSLIHHNYDEPVRWLFNETVEYFKSGKKVEKTDTDQVEAGAYSLHLKLGAQDAGQKDQSTEHILTFVDMPGEFWQTDGNGLTAAFFEQYQGVFQNTDCIWLFLSKICAMKVNLEENPQLARDTSDDTETVKYSTPPRLQANFNALVEHIYESKGLKVPPIVMVLTKSDVDVMDGNPELDQEMKREFNLFPVNQSVYQQNVEETARLFDQKSVGSMPVVNLRALFTQGQAVRQFFDRRSPQYKQAIEGKFAHRYYTAMSAYGHPAQNRDVTTSNPPASFHELHPLIWTLAAFGVVGVRHDVEVVNRNWLGFETGKERVSRYYRYDRRAATGTKVPREDIEANLFLSEKVDGRYKATIEDKNRKGR